MGSEEHVSLRIPSPIKYISPTEVVQLDNVEERTLFNDKHQLTDPSAKKSEISLSMSPSPMEVQIQNTEEVPFCPETEFNNGMSDTNSAPTKRASSSQLQEEAEFHSQPQPKTSAFEEQAIQIGHFPYQPSIERLKDKRFDNFKTWSGKLERQISLASLLRGKPLGKIDQPDNAFVQSTDQVDPLPADRYFDALEGPELDTLRASEEILLPEDKKWPFLLRYHISSFSICLGVSSQAILWKILPTSASTKFLHLSLMPNLVLWFISLALLVIVASIYILKIIFYFEAVRREYFHPIRINFFFSPFIALLFLAIGVPPSISSNLHPALWYILMAPLLCLELKIYGQWMSGGQRRLSKVANPVNHLSIVGNFVGALLGASMGLREGPIFFFAVGMAHYMVLFVTLYQRLTTNETVIPKELHPVFFLFVAAPSVASTSWARIQGSFDVGSRIGYFISMFLYLSLVVRINFFRGFKFSLAWWAYTFPMTGAAVATIRYSNEVTTVATQALAVILSIIATLVVFALFIRTVLHAFVLQDLFPNDLAIAISNRPPNKPSKKWFHLKNGTSSDSKDIENFLKSATSSERKDLDIKTLTETANKL
uniref:S-type anion channel SLAH2-like isoform X2 n=1 Tax=Fragaria vesca subsp. vesca TaxID=101020 RepID=UPI0005C9037D|nr:PREDICTED: S-type anion channel SLAH2-like isoform X2 [Fragaria vesca subsp. vesca]XP_011470300.1 PREDICTED: S-type anion channel SLAH2-like isoform X2 [Fragaria vesca subsp. vesca]